MPTLMMRTIVYDADDCTILIHISPLKGSAFYDGPAVHYLNTSDRIASKRAAGVASQIHAVAGRTTQRGPERPWGGSSGM